ncbi:hypothetical protein MM326_15145 [Alkalihalobacillus sp. LMS6]|uniref:hypothetical protein n=1 Tax=Alkalihalobacillus sp. LMS6 TaxID=2924034 RepID=UPI0020D0BA56|nr:hypothetical protein [Alkalihalobacillus sp. LMS6]UTR05432.1 hypothetical protein MM326_15145 [Alkalihalobacillus sp. LMS6]
MGKFIKKASAFTLVLGLFVSLSGGFNENAGPNQPIIEQHKGPNQPIIETHSGPTQPIIN